ncbi:cathepsin L-like peptidase [Amblyomma americanum]
MSTMMNLLLILSSALAVAYSAENEDLQAEWKEFKAKYGRKYKSSAEEKEKYQIFADNHKYITSHNKNFANGLSSFELGINEYSDMRPDEIVKTMNGYRGKRTRRGGSTYVPPADLNDSSLPQTVDWRTKGAVTPVKNQGHCQSCWAFSATGSLEGHHFLKTRTLVSLSEQNLVDCSGKFHNVGCHGGRPDNSFKYIKANKGIDTEKSYPYVAKNQNCTFKKKDVGATCTGYKEIKEGSEADLKMAVATVGPISVAIDATHESFHSYKRGVYYEPKCSKEHLDHAVLLVGYGVKDGQKYWLVKNSWGKSFGQNGYILMARDKDNHCGIATDAVYPLV